METLESVNKTTLSEDWCQKLRDIM